jgi:hypothetical protein
MKKLIAIVLLLAIPAIAYGQTSISLLNGGNASLDVAVTDLPTTMTLDVVVVLTDTDNSAVSGGLDGTSLITVSAISLGSPQSAWSRFDAYNATNIVGSDLSQNYDFGAVTSGTNVLGSGTTTWATITLNLPDTLVAGESYPIGLVVSKPGGSMLSWASKTSLDEMPYDAENGFTLNITPEPATMLLLAGALPFLRRRTA